MKWYLLFALISTDVQTFVVQGPFHRKDQCIQHEIGHSPRWCVIGCMSWDAMEGEMAELSVRPPMPTCEGVTLNQERIDTLMREMHQRGFGAK
jgi:hypothetical protein